MASNSCKIRGGDRNKEENISFMSRRQCRRAATRTNIHPLVGSTFIVLSTSNEKMLMFFKSSPDVGDPLCICGRGGREEDDDG